MEIRNPHPYWLRRAGHIPRRVERLTAKYTRTWINNALTSAYSLPDEHLRRAAELPLGALSRIQDLTGDNPTGRAFLAEGVDANDATLRTAFAGTWLTGQHNTLPFFLHLIYGDNSPRVTPLGEFPAWQVRRRAEQAAAQADLVVVMCNSLLSWRPRTGSWALGPAGVRMVFDFAPGEPWDAVEKRLRRQRQNLSVMRRGGFRSRFSRSEEDFRFFYQRLYEPMVRERYGNYGDLMNEAGLRAVFKDSGGFLLLNEDETGVVVSGGLQVQKAGVVFGLVNGVRDGDRALVKRGALTACYYFALQWCHQNRVRRFDAGVCLPFTNHGIYQHKEQWGFTPARNLWKPQDLLLWAQSGSPPACEWIAAHPFPPQLARQGG